MESKVGRTHFAYVGPPEKVVRDKLGVPKFSTLRFHKKRTDCGNNATANLERIRETRWRPFKFQLIPSEDNVPFDRKSVLFRYIHLAGGVVIPGRKTDVLHVVRILNEDYFVNYKNEDCDLPPDTYSSAFIFNLIRATNQNQPLPDPSKFLATPSAYASYDVFQILRQERNWSDLTPLDNPPRKYTAQQWIARLRKYRDRGMLQQTNATDLTENEVGNQNVENAVGCISRLVTAGDQSSVSENNSKNAEVEEVHEEIMVPRQSQDEARDFVPPPRKRRSPSPPQVLQSKQSKPSLSLSVNQSESSNVQNSTAPINKKTENTTNVVPPDTSSNSKHPRLVPKAVAGPSNSKNTKCRVKLFGTAAVRSKKDDEGWIQCDNNSDDDVDFELSSNADTDAESTSSKVSHKSSASKKSAPKKPLWARFYSVEDGQKILNTICEQNLFMYTDGLKLWQIIESAEILKGRSFQSLRQHYLKIVVPKVLANETYKISAENLKRLRNSRDKIERNKHSNLCPDDIVIN